VDGDVWIFKRIYLIKEDMKKDDKFKCLKTVNNLLGQPLFIKGETYTVLYVDGVISSSLNPLC